MNNKIKIHIYSPANTITSNNDKRFISCPYTTKVYNMCKMFHNNGHEVIHYGVETSNPPCTENVEYIPYEIWERSHGSKSIERDYEQLGLTYETYQYAEKNLFKEIKKRVNSETDVILNSIGWWSNELYKLNDLAAHIEYGIGHAGATAPYQVFESYAYQNNQYNIDNIFRKKWTGAVIPGYVDEDYFYYDETHNNGKDSDYLAYLGRVITNKGIDLASQIAQNAGLKLKVAGHGNIDLIKNLGDHVEYLGVLNINEKIELLRNSVGLASITYYLEPFANSHIEALMCGVPVIGSDWGVYTESIENNFNGVRIRYWEDAKNSINIIKNLNRKAIAEAAFKKYSLKAIYPQFNKYYETVLKMYKTGWYTNK